MRSNIYAGKVALGLLLGATCAFPQAYTVSAKAGAVNYIEGAVSIDGNPLTSSLRNVNVNSNSTLATGPESKAEVLLTPGSFARLGSASSIKMVSTSLVDTEFEVTGGEVIVEVSELENGNSIAVLDHGASVRLKKTGVYRFTAQPALAQVLDGKAEIDTAGRKLDIGKDHEVDLASADAKEHKFSPKDIQDDLYAWSKDRDQYVAAASYSASRSLTPPLYSNAFYGGDYFGGFGINPLFGGWMYAPGWSTYAFIPGYGAFYSPFGYGYYSPYVVGYAPVVYVYPTGTTNGGGTSPTKKPVPVPVNPTHAAIAGIGGAKPVVPGHPEIQPAAFAHVQNGGHLTTGAVHAAVAGGGHSSGGGGGYYGGGGSRTVSVPQPAPAPVSSAHSGGGGHH